MCNIRKKLFNSASVIILAPLLLQGICPAAQTASVSVVFSSVIEPYRLSYDGFKEFFDEKKFNLRVYKHNLETDNAERIYSAVKSEKPDLIFAIGTKALQSASENITDTPVVFAMVLNPRKINASNISGVSLDIPAEIKLKNLKKIVPEKKSIGLIYSPQSEPLYKDIQQTCEELEYRLISKKIDSKTEFSGVLGTISSQIDCFLMTPDTDIYYPKLVEYLLRESLKENIPVIGLSSNYAKAGALIAFDCDYLDIGKQAGEIAFRIVSGQKQAQSKCISPRKIKYSLNLTTAEMLGIEISPEIIKQASEVFGK
jgi:putative ABC transport system substrate-binding protein